MKTKILLALTVVALGIAMSTTTMAAQDSEASTVNVSVTSELAVNVAPENFVYTNDPGTVNETSKNGYDGIEIENTGSKNISEVWLGSSDPVDRPFGTGTSAEYDAGNFIQAKPSSEVDGLTGPPQNGFAYISRKDFNESNTLSYFKEPDTGNEVRYGRFRMANESFFYAISQATSGGSATNQCDGTGSSELYVGKEPHSETQTGSVDFTDSSNYNLHTLSNAGDNYARADNVGFNTYEGTLNTTVLTWCGDGSSSADNSTHIIGTRWDLNEQEDGSTGTYATDADSLEYILDAGNNDQEFQPGEHFTVFTRVAVPNAVAEGDVTQGTLTVYVSDANV